VMSRRYLGLDDAVLLHTYSVAAPTDLSTQTVFLPSIRALTL